MVESDLKSGGPGTGGPFEDKVFLWLLVAISLAFAWIITPLYGAVLWAIVIAILFSAMHQRILDVLRRPNIAAAATTLVILVIVILPLAILTMSVVEEATDVYDKIKSGNLDLKGQIQKMFDAVPGWATGWMNRFGVASLSDVKDRLGGEISKGGQFLVAQAITIGHGTFDFLLNLFVMLYVLFFLLRDGKDLVAQIKTKIPLRADHKEALFERFAVVVRATIKGNMVVALLQGGLGGLIFWILGIQGALLWGALMALLSLLPAVGAAMVWLPVAIYLLATGAIGKGIVLLVFGGVVISLVDNLVRPMLVGKDTKMPDYIVLVATLGGIAIFGVNGFVLGPLIAAMFISVWQIYRMPQSRGI
jgi:predicted PurR-regulated permease PerM